MNRIFRIWAFGGISDLRGEFSPLGESEGVSVGNVMVVVAGGSCNCCNGCRLSIVCGEFWGLRNGYYMEVVRYKEI